MLPEVKKLGDVLLMAVNRKYQGSSPSASDNTYLEGKYDCRAHSAKKGDKYK